MINKTSIIKRIKLIQNYLCDNDLDGFIQPRADSYLGEYVPKSDARLEWISGFTGSAGVILVLRKKVILFVDSRYTIQAKHETKNTGIKIILSFKQSLEKYILKNIKNFTKIAFDPWLYSYSYIQNIKNIETKINSQFVPLKKNAIDYFWSINRNSPPNSPIKVHPLKYAGISSSIKIKKLSIYLKKLKAKAYIINQPDA